ncbi:MAG: DUF1761 domain-containing protein [Paracoccaceae bacterium]
MENVNWTAVIAGTIVAFLLGWLWYSPKMFGKGWAEGSKVELGAADSMPMFAMIAQVVALFLLALVIGITATTDALITAIIAILAAAAFAVSGGAFIKKSQYAITIDGLYIVVAGIIMIAAQGIL